MLHAFQTRFLMRLYSGTTLAARGLRKPRQLERDSRKVAASTASCNAVPDEVAATATAAAAVNKN